MSSDLPQILGSSRARKHGLVSALSETLIEGTLSRRGFARAPQISPILQLKLSKNVVFYAIYREILCLCAFLYMRLEFIGVIVHGSGSARKRIVNALRSMQFRISVCKKHGRKAGQCSHRCAAE